jgi:hypothetical protein
MQMGTALYKLTFAYITPNLACRLRCWVLGHHPGTAAVEEDALRTRVP